MDAIAIAMPTFRSLAAMALEPTLSEFGTVFAHVSVRKSERAETSSTQNSFAFLQRKENSKMENLILYGKTIAFLATDGFEQIELTEPWKAIKNAGGTVKLVSPKIEGTIRGVHHDVPGDEFVVDVLSSDAIVEEYDALVLPGGVFNPDALRLDHDSIQFVRSFFDAHKPVAAICHGPWLLIEADVIDGRKLTSWPSLKTDIINAGGTWLDEACVCDEGLITSRSPKDLAVFCETTIKEFAKGVPAVQPELSDSTPN